MKKIELSEYKRNGMFYAFKDREIPYFSTCANVDITYLKKYIDYRKINFFLAISYLLSKTVNNIPELRHRIIGDELFEFEVVHPGFTVLLNDDTFSFCDSKHFDNFEEYCTHSKNAIDKVKNYPDTSTVDKHDMFFITNIPWFSFTSITHPYSKKYGSIPIISIGKYFQTGESINLPIGIQVNHATVDGIHVGKFYNKTSEKCFSPEKYFQ